MTDYAAARTAMVDCQVRPSDVTSFPVIEAMLTVPRERFVPAAMRPVAYLGEHLPLGPGRVLLDPRVFAKMIDAADPTAEDVALDLACGLGYSTAVLARFCAAVTGVESDAAMARGAAQTLGEMQIDNAVVLEGDPAQGAPDGSEASLILVNGAVEVLPEAVRAQLRDGGRIVAIRREGELGVCEVTTRVGDRFVSRRVFDATAPVLPGFARAPAFEF